MKNNEKNYRKKSIYILHYPKAKDIEASYGQISSINEKDINHLCITDKGSSGSPILSLDSFKVVGIHKGATRLTNRGIFIKSAINAFHERFKNGFKIISKKNKKSNEMIIKYDYGDYEYIRLFSKKFVENNKNNCKLIINGKDEMELCEYINKNDYSSPNKKIEVKLIETNTIIDMSYMFFECRRLKAISDTWNTVNVNNMSFMFASCVSLRALNDVSNWDTSNVTNMKGMFELCISLTKFPNISKWDTRNVQDMQLMFNKCFFLTSLPDISNWETNNVINFSGIFNECICLKELPDISKWDISNVENISYMFNKCMELKYLPDISYWNTSKVKNMCFLFNDCCSLEKLPNISIWDIHNTVDKLLMFNGCNKLANIPSDKFNEY